MVNLEKISFQYPKKPILFDNLSLHLEPGNIYGLLGKNGAGKTTLLKVLCGLLFPDEGTASVLNYTPLKREPGFLKDIYFIPEEFFIPALSMSLFINLYTPFYPHFDKEVFWKAVKEFDVPTSSKLSTISYGQKKKFLIAFAIATNCRLLILDEPTNGLDIPTKSIFRKLVASHIKDDQIFIISTHQVRDLENLIDPVIVLDEGQIIFQHTVYEVEKHLTVQLFNNEPKPGETLFYEKVMGGYAAVVKNTGAEENRIDIELMFNTIVNNRTTIKELFAKEIGDEK